MCIAILNRVHLCFWTFCNSIFCNPLYSPVFLASPGPALRLFAWNSTVFTFRELDNNYALQKLDIEISFRFSLLFYLTSFTPLVLQYSCVLATPSRFVRLYVKLKWRCTATPNSNLLSLRVVRRDGEKGDMGKQYERVVKLFPPFDPPKTEEPKSTRKPWLVVSKRFWQLSWVLLLNRVVFFFIYTDLLCVKRAGFMSI